MWVLLAFAAGLFQSARNGLSRSLAHEVSAPLISWSRFAFNLPFATAVVLLIVVTRGGLALSTAYLGFCLATALAQLSGNIALVAAFRHATFAKSIVLHKLEIAFTAVVGALVFAEVPTAIGWLGIATCATGVIAIHVSSLETESRGRRADTDPAPSWPQTYTGSFLALLAGLLLVFASFWLKEANEVLVALNPRVGSGRFEVAAHTLFHVTWIEVLVLTGYLWTARRTELRMVLVPRYFFRMSLIGLTGFVGSLGWFWAYSLTLVAYVKAVGQIESVVAVLLSLLVWHERAVLRQLPGMFLVLGGILLVLFGR